MSYLTKQESLVLMALAVIIFTGSCLEYIFKRYPHIDNMVNVVESEMIYSKVDLNKASVEELVQIPYIGQYTANNIVEFRQKNGAFTSLEQIKQVKGIRDKNYERFRKFLYVSTKTKPGN